MKSTLLTLFILLTVSPLTSNGKDFDMFFPCLNIDIGVVGIKETKNAIFHFENRGKRPFVILEAKSSCGCTVAKYNRKPIQPQKQDSVVIKFKPNETGLFYKKIVIKNSSGESQTLAIKGSVK